MTETPHDEYAHPTVQLRVCGAKTRAGTPCQRHPMANGRCVKHGGASLKGIASPTWKDGRFSKYLPQNLGQIAHEAALDPDLFNLRELIGVYEARLKYLMGLVGSGASAKRFHDIQETWAEFRMAQETGPAGKGRMIAAANKMDRLVMGEQGEQEIGHDYMVWQDMDVAAKNYKLLIESERKRAIEAHSLFPVIKAHDFARDVLLIVRRVVTDRGQWRTIQDSITELVGSNYPQIAETPDRGQDGDEG